MTKISLSQANNHSSFSQAHRRRIYFYISFNSTTKWNFCRIFKLCFMKKGLISNGTMQDYPKNLGLLSNDGVPWTSVEYWQYIWLTIIFLTIALPVLVFGQTISTKKRIKHTTEFTSSVSGINPSKISTSMGTASGKVIQAR